MSDIFFDGDYLQLIKYDEENGKGIIISSVVIPTSFWSIQNSCRTT